MALLHVASALQGHGTLQGTLSAAADQPLAAGLPTDSETMTYLMGLLQKFKKFAKFESREVEARHAEEEKRLDHAVATAQDPGVKLALTQSIEANKQSLVETQKLYTNMGKFSSSLEGVLKAATSKGASCEMTKCGKHATCTDTTQGANCVCNEGYVGLGQECLPPPEFVPHVLLFEGAGASKTRAADMQVSVFGDNQVGIVYRDLSKANAGRVLVGSVREAGTADLSPPEQFTISGGKAYDPIFTGTNGRRAIIAWRDEDRRGSCWMRGASMGASGIRGAELAITWGQPVNFCGDQSHKMATVALPNNRVALLFSDKAQATEQTPAESFGNSLLASITKTGGLDIKGKYRFSDSAVCRLETTRVTPNGFVLAARASKAADDVNSSATINQEALAMFGELIEDELVFNPNTVSLEPSKDQIWARGLSLIADHTVAYAYQDGMDMEMKIAVIDVNPTSHRLKVVLKPTKVAQGFSPYVSMLSVPYTPSEPHTLVYYEADGFSKVNLCSWETEGHKLDRCEDFTWLSQKLTSVSGVHLGGAKSFMVFTPESGVPYYGVFGLSKRIE